TGDAPFVRALAAPVVSTGDHALDQLAVERLRETFLDLCVEVFGARRLLEHALAVDGEPMLRELQALLGARCLALATHSSEQQKRERQNLAGRSCEQWGALDRRHWARVRARCQRARALSILCRHFETLVTLAEERDGEPGFQRASTSASG